MGRKPFEPVFCWDLGSPAHTLAPTAPTAAPPAPTAANCKAWCAKDTKSWSQKCAFKNTCDGCSDCDALPPTAAPPTAATPTAAPASKRFYGAVWKSPTCTDYKDCSSSARSLCHEGWAVRRCPLSCGQCVTCELGGDWSEWTDCSAPCGTGGQTRTRAAGTCAEPYTESRQCNLSPCDVGKCTLTSSSPIVVTDVNNKVIENIFISSTGSNPAIDIRRSVNVTIRNVHIVHEGSAAACNGAVEGCSGPGIYFRQSPGITIENVMVEMQRPVNKHIDAEECSDRMCGPFPQDMVYAFNIQGYQSDRMKMRNVHVKGGASGFWCQGCTHGVVSHFKAENVHGPYPRGQCLQVTSSDNFLLEDFYCLNDKSSFTEDTISLWESSHSMVRRGLIDGGNGPNGVGVMMERSHDTVVADVDITNNRKGGFSGYGSSDVLFLRNRAKNNHGPNKQCHEGAGFCMDFEGTNHCCGGTHPDGNTQSCYSCTERVDCGGDVWYAGDYDGKIAGGKYSGAASNIRVKQGIIHNLATARGDSECVDVTPSSWEAAGAGRMEAYIERDLTDEDFELRKPVEPVFCWDLGSPAQTLAPTAPTAAPPTAAPAPASANCQSWCAKNTQPWSKKCGWSKNCNECSECGNEISRRKDETGDAAQGQAALIFGIVCGCVVLVVVAGCVYVTLRKKRHAAPKQCDLERADCQTQTDPVVYTAGCEKTSEPMVAEDNGLRDAALVDQSRSLSLEVIAAASNEASRGKGLITL